MPKRKPNKYDAQLVHRLPNEILVYVFSYFSYQHTFNEDSDSITALAYRDVFDDSRETPAWVTIMLVCRRWYNLYSCTPSLWSTIPWAPVSWTRSFLKKSKNASVSLSFPVCADPRTKTSVSMMLMHLHRTRDLYLKLELNFSNLKRKAPSLPAGFKSRTADVLTKLSIDHPVSGSTPPYFIDDDIFAGHAPNIRDVTLSGPIEFNWTNLIFSSKLERLVLTHSCSKEFEPSADILLNLLDRVKGTLQILTLVYCLESFKEKPHRKYTELISLASLKELSLGGPAPCVAHFLDCVLLPPVTKMGLIIGVRYTNDSFTSSLQISKRILSTLLDPVHAAQSDSIPLFHVSRRGDTLNWDFEADNMGEGDSRLVFMFGPDDDEDRFSAPNVGRDQSQVFATLAPLFVRGHVKTLEIDNRLPLETEDWGEFFGRLGGLEYLDIGDFSSAFARALDGDVGTKLVKGLTDLYLAVHADSGSYDTGEFADALISVLVKRQCEDIPDVVFHLLELDEVSPALSQWGDEVCERVANLYDCTVEELLGHPSHKVQSS